MKDAAPSLEEQLQMQSTLQEVVAQPVPVPVPVAQFLNTFKEYLTEEYGDTLKKFCEKDTDDHWGTIIRMDFSVARR